MLHKLCLTLLFFVSLPAFCANTTGKITSIIINADLGNAAAIMVSGTTYNQNSCQNQNWNYAIDLSTEAGRGQLAIALMAYASGKTVVAAEKVDSNCNLIGGTQTLSYIYTQ